MTPRAIAQRERNANLPEEIRCRPPLMNKKEFLSSRQRVDRLTICSERDSCKLKDKGFGICRRGCEIELAKFTFPNSKPLPLLTDQSRMKKELRYFWFGIENKGLKSSKQSFETSHFNQKFRRWLGESFWITWHQLCDGEIVPILESAIFEEINTCFRCGKIGTSRKVTSRSNHCIVSCISCWNKVWRVYKAENEIFSNIALINKLTRAIRDERKKRENQDHRPIAGVLDGDHGGS